MVWSCPLWNDELSSICLHVRSHSSGWRVASPLTQTDSACAPSNLFRGVLTQKKTGGNIHPVLKISKTIWQLTPILNYHDGLPPLEAGKATKTCSNCRPKVWLESRDRISVVLNHNYKSWWKMNSAAALESDLIAADLSTLDDLCSVTFLSMTSATGK